MNILELFTNHSHYWGVPHLKSTDNRLIQICYGCGKERLVKVNLLLTGEPAHRLYDTLNNNLAG
jgi:hypothetical protein